MTDNGMIYHLPALKIAKAPGSQAEKKLVSDITCLTVEDSLSFTATIITKEYFKVDSASFNGKWYLAETYFVERKKKVYRCRVNIRIPYTEFVGLFQQDRPLQIDYGKHMTFGFSHKIWPALRAEVLDFLYIVKLNK